VANVRNLKDEVVLEVLAAHVEADGLHLYLEYQSVLRELAFDAQISAISASPRLPHEVLRHPAFEIYWAFLKVDYLPD
jgi:hypothetical protein